MQTTAIAVRLTRKQIRALRFGHTLPAEEARKLAPVIARKLSIPKPKSRDGITWDPVIGRTLWNVGLFGPESTFNFGWLIGHLGRPVLDYRGS